MTSTLIHPQHKPQVGNRKSILGENPASASTLPHARNPAHLLAAQLDLITRCSQLESLAQCLQLLVDEAQTFSGCQAVALGFAESNQRCDLRVISHVPKLDQTSESTRLFAEALQEGLHQAQLTQWLPRDSRAVLPALSELGKSLAAETILTAPLLNAKGKPLGIWTFVGPPKNLCAEEFKAWVSACASVIGSHLDLLQRTHESACKRVFSTTIQQLRKKAVWLVIAAVVAVVLVVVKIPYQVSTAAVLQPVTKRFVAAPFQGQLEKCLVKLGDLVQQGQLMACMEGRDLRNEVATLQAEADQARKEYDVNLAKGKLASAQVAGLEMDRLQQRMQLLTRRIEQLEIRSPVAGVVLAGDLEQSIDAPVNVGEALFQVAPLDHLACEIEIPDTEIAHVQIGQSLRVVLDAFPAKPYEGTLERIHPRSELRDQKNVFIGKVTFDNVDGELRPGMKGQVSIATAPQRVGWILLHRPWECAASWLGW